jgi:hypothetical protein
MRIWAQESWKMKLWIKKIWAFEVLGAKWSF